MKKITYRYLHCRSCEKKGNEQPEYFYEVMAWVINRVNKDGSFIDMKDGELDEYRCPECDNEAVWIETEEKVKGALKIAWNED